MQLRNYQITLVERVRAEYRDGARSVLMQLGTGGGKTATASTLIERAVARGRRVVFAAHLDALIDDTSERLASAGIAHGIVQADRPMNRKPFTKDVRREIALAAAWWQAGAEVGGGGSVRESASGGGHGQCVGVSDVELWVLREHSVRQ